MANKIDTEHLLSRVDIVEVIGKQVHLEQQGSEFVGLCPFHEDSKPSLQVNKKKQIYKCFVCEAGGDAIDFLKRGGMTFREACDHLDGKTGNFSPSPVPIQRKSDKPDRTPVIPVPASAPKPRNEKKLGRGQDAEHLRFIKRWEYRDAAGALIGYTVRFHDRAGKKYVFPQTFVDNGEGKQYWAWSGFPKPRPIYGLSKLSKRPDATVLILEGEKAADHAAKLFPDLVTIAWQGGTDGVSHVDWSPLYGRKNVIWPDNDEPGMKAAAFIGKHLQEMDPKTVVRYIVPPPGCAKGWDIADSDWTAEQALGYVQTKGVQSKEVPEAMYDEPKSDPVPEPEKKKDKPIKVEKSEDEETFEKGHFKFLGFEKGEGAQYHCFYVQRSKTIIRMSTGGMSKNNLLQLVPDPTWWEMQFPAKNGFNIDAAVSWMISESYSRGMFDEALVRGRGAWVDDGRTVLHSGNYLVVNGVRVPLGSMKSRYMYEQSTPLEFATENPLSTVEAHKLMEMLKMVNWERNVSAYLLAGWCVIAPVCGALRWRPHIWITGGAGTGKSWILEQVVRPLLGETGLAVQGETTEAGLRQTLKHDAMPIVFDEADTDGKTDNERIQKVLAIMRSASTNDGGKIIKGSAGGRAMDFSIKSCFALGSIAVQAAKQADKTRISVLAIKRILDIELREKRWATLQRMHVETMSSEYTERMQARTIRLLPTILENARTFAAAAGVELGYQRTGDQVGALLAGAYSLHNTSKITYDEALAWIREQDWTEERGSDEDRDEIMLLGYILEQIIWIEHGYNRLERTIGELIQIVGKPGATGDEITTVDAEARLNRHGIRVKDGFFIIANKGEWLRKILKATPWANGHNKVLQRIEGAQQAGSIRFASGLVSKAVAIPLKHVME